MARLAQANNFMVFFLLLLLSSLIGCAGKDKGNGYEHIDFVKVGEFSDRRKQATIKLYTYSGPEVEEENIRAFAENLGCGMVYGYFYPVSPQAGIIPGAELSNAGTFAEAEEILYQGEGYSRWHFSSQCLGVIPMINDCRQHSLSMHCR